MTLADRLLGLHRAYLAAGIPHAFGGAIALAFWTLDPRGTSDSQIAAFGGVGIPILGPVELAVFKAMLDRTQDWADIEAMLRARTLDVHAVKDTLSALLGGDDPRFARLDHAQAQAEPA